MMHKAALSTSEQAHTARTEFFPIEGVPKSAPICYNTLKSVIHCRTWRRPLEILLSGNPIAIRKYRHLPKASVKKPGAL